MEYGYSFKKIYKGKSKKVWCIREATEQRRDLKFSLAFSIFVGWRVDQKWTIKNECEEVTERAVYKESNN